ncbi:YY1-associated factor 2 isoform X2 [Lissotriton helveticus]
MTARPASPAPEGRTAGEPGGGACASLPSQYARRDSCVFFLSPSTRFRSGLFTNTKGYLAAEAAVSSLLPLPCSMGDKKSPTRPKRQPKPSSDEGYWDCSVCTFRNGAEAFKCMMCDVRKGTSTRRQPGQWMENQEETRRNQQGGIFICKEKRKRKTRKPRPVAQLVSQQVTQQFVPPPQVKKEKKEKEKDKEKVEKVEKEKVEKEKVEKEKSEKDTPIKKNSQKKSRLSYEAKLDMQELSITHPLRPSLQLQYERKSRVKVQCASELVLDLPSMLFLAPLSLLLSYIFRRIPGLCLRNDHAIHG